MAWYAYKDVVYRIPEKYTAMVENYEGEVNYDGDAWTATGFWIDGLLDEIKELKAKLAEKEAALRGATDTGENHA
jgi:hypothetical protein